MLSQEAHQRIAKIKYELALRDYTQADVASELKVKPTSVGAVIQGRSRSKKIELRIAAITRMSLAELWPQWHGDQVKSRRRRRNSNTQATEALRASAR